MTTHRTLHAPLSLQALSMALAVLVTAGLLGSVLGIAAEDQAAQMASSASSASSASPASQADLSARQAADRSSARTTLMLQAKAPAQRARRG